MPTVVHFNRAEESIRLDEDFDKVNSQHHGSDGGLFNRKVGDSRNRVTIYKSAISYIEEAAEVEAYVMHA
jgi:hypothetical protein